MTLVNLTPHAISFTLHGLTIAPSGQVARCTQTSTPAGDVMGIPLSRTTFGAVEGLPEPVEGTIFIVSALVRGAVPNRTDVASPGELVRNVSGAVIGCNGLIVN